MKFAGLSFTYSLCARHPPGKKEVIVSRWCLNIEKKAGQKTEERGI